MDKGDVALSTPVRVVKADVPLDFEAGMCAVGSCFSQELAARLAAAGMDMTSNPNGIVYNAASMCAALERACSGPAWGADDFFEHGGMYHGFHHHGEFSARTLELALERAEARRTAFGAAARRAALFILTPSSSVVYRHLDTGMIVANCHKVPQQHFSRELLSVADNLDCLCRCVAAAAKVNPECRIVITLSPVRHYPGDLQLNARSKANLLSAIHECVDAHPQRCVYFPSYEILNDELRDYRFYAEDMLHPSPLTRELIFRRFVGAYFSAGAGERIAVAEKAARHASHRAIHE